MLISYRSSDKILSRDSGEGTNRFVHQLRPYAEGLFRGSLSVLQINVGRKCNQACRHCHVDAAPWRTEMMDRKTAHRIGAWIAEHRPATIDLTGGAPELSRHFRYFVTLGRDLGLKVIDRNNLTIIEESGFEDLPSFLAANEVEIIASLPCYSAQTVNRQRGDRVFDRSISALRKLNAVGYGKRLILRLVHNPLGAKLPGPQEELEADYKEVLRREFGIEFNSLLTLTNQPIARFAEELRSQGQWESYLDLLANNFNPQTLPELMCRNTLSVDYQGRLYDCDFNQMLNLPLGGNGESVYLWDVNPERLEGLPVATGEHCLACTAGEGSSCQGALL